MGETMRISATKNKLYQVVIPHTSGREVSILRRKRFYITLALVFVTLLLAAALQYGRSLQEMPPI